MLPRLLLVLVLGCTSTSGDEGDGPRRVTPLVDAGGGAELGAPMPDVEAPAPDVAPPVPDARPPLDPAALPMCRVDNPCPDGMGNIRSRVLMGTAKTYCQDHAIGAYRCRLCDWVCTPGVLRVPVETPPCRSLHSDMTGSGNCSAEILCVRSCDECPTRGDGYTCPH